MSNKDSRSATSTALIARFSKECLGHDAELVVIPTLRTATTHLVMLAVALLLTYATLTRGHAPPTLTTYASGALGH